MIAKRIKREKASSFQRLSAYITTQPDIALGNELERTVSYITGEDRDGLIVSDDLSDLGMPGVAVAVDPVDAEWLGMVDEGWDGAELAGSAEQPHRVGQVRITNCDDVDVAGATAEIQAVQARNTRSKADKTYHLVFSFPAGEQPTAEQLVDIEDALCSAIGLGEHQRISAVHHDTENLHVHVAINKVHPRTYRNVEPYFDMPKLQEACIAAEIKHGLTRTNHGIKAETRAAKKAVPSGAPTDAAEFLMWVKERAAPILRGSASWSEANRHLSRHGLEVRLLGAGAVLSAPGSDVSVKASDVGREFSLAGLSRRWGEWESAHSGPAHQDVDADDGRLAPRAADMEAHAGRQSATAWMRANVPGIVTSALNWEDLHEKLAQHGVEVRRQKSGVVFVAVAQGRAVAGGGVADECKYSRLARRFGPFVGKDGARHPDPAADQGYTAQPLQKHSKGKELFAAYLVGRAAALAERKRARDSLNGQHTAYRAELARWYAERRASIRKRNGLTRSGKAAELADLERERVEEFERHREVVAEQRKEIAASHPLLTWMAFLQQRAGDGDTVALAILRSRTKAAQKFSSEFLTASTADDAKDIVLPKLAPKVSKSGALFYRTRDGGTVVDQARSVDIQEGSLGAAALAVLIAAEKFKGTQLAVEGSSEFKRQVAQAAAVCGLDVPFEDPALEAVKNHYQTARQVMAEGKSFTGGKAEDFGSPDVRVDLPEDMAKRLGVVDEAALNPADARAARGMPPEEAVAEYVKERNEKRQKMYDIAYHRPWEPTDLGPFEYHGRRRLAGQADVVLLKGEQGVLVKMVSPAQMAKASTFAVGQIIQIDGQGRFSDRQAKSRRK